jgi:hypothetical protein
MHLLNKAVQVFKNMGWRYVRFRSTFELKKRFGLLKKAFPTNPNRVVHVNLKDWRSNSKPFFFHSKDGVKFNSGLSSKLEQSYQAVVSGKLSFFSNLEITLGLNYDWITNPDTGYRYDEKAHWLDIQDFDSKAGDIKYVWEPSRFSHLYTIIRYDHATGKDCSKQVFSQIDSWMNANEINRGPNFKCSQEISLRALNWIFAIYYYKNSPYLTEELFSKIQHYLFWQIDHVYQNIDFSRIAVRNNHAITETLALYIVGILFPQFPNADRWRKNGKRWFEEEISYQVFEDGTFLQYSMNYHRVVIQLLTWGIRLAELNNDPFSRVVYERAEKSFKFLESSMNPESGWLPNYGPNDGALFFKFGDEHFRDYRPQLEALAHTLKLNWLHTNHQDSLWYGLSSKDSARTSSTAKSEMFKFQDSGYYMFKTPDSFTFLRCGDHRTRPTQADNLHLDIWFKGLNIFHDGGSYKYNAPEIDSKYFRGTESHNTVMLNNFDQMQRGSRFMWFYWTQSEKVKNYEDDQYFFFEGTIKSFQYLSKEIRHTRKVKIHKFALIWEIEDFVANKPESLQMRQLWHTRYLDRISFESNTSKGVLIAKEVNTGYVADLYGTKEVCDQVEFSTTESYIKTIIRLDNENTADSSIL